MQSPASVHEGLLRRARPGETGFHFGLPRFELLISTALALAYFVVAAVSIHKFGTNTPIWFANALAVAVLLRRKPTYWLLSLTLIYVANFFAISNWGTGPAALVAPSDVLEIALAACALRWIGGPETAFSSVVGLARYIIICGIVTLPGSAWGAAILWWTEGGPFLSGFGQWYAATSLGLLVVGPYLLIWSTPEVRQQSEASERLPTGYMAVALAILTAIVFTQGNPVYLFTTFPLLMLLVWRSGLVGATAGGAVILLVSLSLTLSGQGPIFALMPPPTNMSAIVFALQLYLAALTLTSLPLAVVLAHQRELSRKLAIAAQARGDFLAAMSHEIRTPLTGVLGMADILAAEPLDAKHKSYVEAIRTSGRHLLSLINDILDFSRIESGVIELEDVDFSLPVVLEHVRSFMTPIATEQEIALKFELEEHSPPIVKGDPTRLKQVLLNLVGNAIKFTPHGTVTVAVSYRRTAEGLRFRFEVRDTGIGIAPEKHVHLFTPFTQADNSTTREFGGTGLGLVISQRLVNAMGGEIGLSSVVGEGSTFWFEMPSTEGNAIILSAPEAVEPERLAPRRVLVAEDVELNRDVIQTVLERDGHSVTFALNGQQAIELVHQACFDIILMDVQMPLMGGIEATRQIRLLPPPIGDIPIIALTANAMTVEREKCIEAGMDDVLTKPIEWDLVRATLARHDLRASRGIAIGTAFASGEDCQRAPNGPVEDISSECIDEVFSEATFIAICEMIPSERLDVYIEALDGDVATLARITVNDDPSTIQDVAHKIVSQAGMLGLVRISAVARCVEGACCERDGLSQALEEFRRVAPDLRHRLRPKITSDSSCAV